MQKTDGISIPEKKRVNKPKGLKDKQSPHELHANHRIPLRHFPRRAIFMPAISLSATFCPAGSIVLSTIHAAFNPWLVFLAPIRRPADSMESLCQESRDRRLAADLLLAVFCTKTFERHDPPLLFNSAQMIRSPVSRNAFVVSSIGLNRLHPCLQLANLIAFLV